MVLRNSIDVYKIMSLSVVLSIWMLHWLASKRCKGLVGEENRDRAIHMRLLILFAILISLDALVSYIFAVQFYKQGTKMSDIYIMVGFEVCNSKFWFAILLFQPPKYGKFNYQNGRETR